MGANTYLAAVGSYGYKTESAATAIEHNIDPRAGERISIRAAQFFAGTATASSVYFLQSLGSSTIATAVASNATTGFALAAEPVAANALASYDKVCIELDNGDFQYTSTASGTWSDFSIAAALTDTVAAGNRVWSFGIATDTGHLRFALTHSVANTLTAVDGGVLYASGKNQPLIVHMLNDSAAAGYISYVTVDYINI